MANKKEQAHSNIVASDRNSVNETLPQQPTALSVSDETPAEIEGRVYASQVPTFELERQDKEIDQQLLRDPTTSRQIAEEERREIVERIIQAESEIIQLDHKLQTLQYASLAFVSSLDLQSVLDTVTKEMASLVKVDGCAIFEWDQGGDRIFLTVKYGLERRWAQKSLLDEFHPLAKFPLIKRVLVEQRPQQMTTSNPCIYPAELAYMQKAKLKTLLMVPMRFQDRTVGLVKIMDSQVERPFGNKEIGLVQLLANQIASAIENNRLYDQVRQEIARRSQTEKELRWLATRNQAILNAIPDSMFCFNREGHLLGYKMTDDTSLPPGILGELTIGSNLNEMLSPELVEQALNHIDLTLTSGKMQVFDYQLPLPQGRQDFEMRLVVRNPNEVLAIVRNITERKQAEEALQKLADTLAENEARLLAEMQSTLVITRALVSEIDLNTLLEFIITQAEHLTYADGAAVLLLTEDGHQLEVATPGESPYRIKSISRISVQGTLAGLAVSNQQVQISTRPHDDERMTSILSLLQPAEIASLLLVPLMAQSRKLGVLLIWREGERDFTVGDIRLASLFADQAALALNNAHLHARNRQLAIEQERHRLARELHDSVTQSLYGIGLAAQASLRLLGHEADSKVREPLEYIHTLSQTALAEIREQITNLHPTTLANKGLVEVITQDCQLLREKYRLAIEFKTAPEPPLSIQQRRNLYYIVREALWNIVKYAEATHVYIALEQDQDKLLLLIEDDGVGFDLSLFAEKEATGLRSMQERAEQLGGVFELCSAPGQGTQIAVRISCRLL